MEEKEIKKYYGYNSTGEYFDKKVTEKTINFFSKNNFVLENKNYNFIKIIENILSWSTLFRLSFIIVAAMMLFLLFLNMDILGTVTIYGMPIKDIIWRDLISQEPKKILQFIMLYSGFFILISIILANLKKIILFVKAVFNFNK